MNSQQLYITLLAFLAALNGGVTAAYAFTHSPESATEYLGARATFTCITDGSHFEILFWTVNEVLVEVRLPVFVTGISQE